MKKFYLFVPVFLSVLIIVTSVTPIVNRCESISNKVFRLHIIANSNSDYDQNLKLKVRDSIINYSKDLYCNCNSLNEAIETTENHINDLINTAQATLAFYGCDYEVSALVSKEYFNVRKYDNFILPSGYYNCLKMTIGEGRGRNWWCVMFPSVCLSGCTDNFEGVLTEEEQKMIEDKKYIVKFKTVEIYENLKRKVGR